MNLNQEQVKEFFNSHSADYKQKYNKKNVFYEYFFFERLEEATNQLDLDNKFILDVGAGTGPLYDYLDAKGVNLENYLATDISNEMMSQGNIPSEQMKNGDLLELDFNASFDFVFMLGVTTYMNEETIRKNFLKIESLLKPGGTLVVTFTNKKSLDILIRGILKPIARLFSKKETILSQKFNTWYYSKNEVVSLVPENLKIKKLANLNHTFFPLSRLLPSLSVKMAKNLHRYQNSFLSSDLLFFIHK